jgi:hypothetical protein
MAATVILTGAAVMTPIILTSCSNKEPDKDIHNPLTDFTVEVSTIQDYAIKVTGTENPDYVPPDIDPNMAKTLEGIIITG